MGYIQGDGAGPGREPPAQNRFFDQRLPVLTQKFFSRLEGCTGGAAAGVLLPPGEGVENCARPRCGHCRWSKCDNSLLSSILVSNRRVRRRGGGRVHGFGLPYQVRYRYWLAIIPNKLRKIKNMIIILFVAKVMGNCY